MNNGSKEMAAEVLECVSFRLRRAARMAAKRYDEALRPVGLRNTQFSILGALAYLGEIGIGDLAEELATDGTTLTRNLDVLVRRGLVENLSAEDGRVRRLHLTTEGRKLFAKALPLWRAVQAETLKSVGDSSWRRTRGVLSKIEKAAGP